MIQNGGCVTIPLSLMHMVTGVHCCRSTLRVSHSLYLSLLCMLLSSLTVIEAVHNVKCCGSRETVVTTITTTTTVLYSPQLNTQEYLYISVAVVATGGCAAPTHTCSNQGWDNCAVGCVIPSPSTVGWQQLRW